MAGASIRIDDREVLEALKRLEQAGGDLTAAFSTIGEKLLRSHRERFNQQRDPEGKPWAPLSPKYRARKKRNQDKTLVLYGYLSSLLRYQVGAGGTRLELGTDRVYGATHQFGDPKRNIPARPYLGLTDDDRRMILEVFNDHHRRALEG
jgi:phage virion morphogenesis protein